MVNPTAGMRKTSAPQVANANRRSRGTPVARSVKHTIAIKSSEAKDPTFILAYLARKSFSEPVEVTFNEGSRFIGNSKS
jgi:hypothetical protein